MQGAPRTLLPGAGSACNVAGQRAVSARTLLPGAGSICNVAGQRAVSAPYERPPAELARRKGWTRVGEAEAGAFARGFPPAKGCEMGKSAGNSGRSPILRRGAACFLSNFYMRDVFVFVIAGLWSRHYRQLSNKYYYLLYLIQLMTALIYYGLPYFNMDLQWRTFLYFGAVLLGAAYLALNRSHRFPGMYIWEYVFVFVILYLADKDWLYFSEGILFLIQAVILVSCFVAFHVKFRFHVSAASSILFTCLSLVVACFSIDFYLSRITLVRVPPDVYSNVLYYCVAGNLAIVAAVAAIYIPTFGTLFGKLRYGVTLGVVAAFARSRKNLIIEDRLRNSAHLNISNVHRLYSLVVNYYTLLPASIALLVVGLVFMPFQNLNLSMLLLIFSVSYVTFNLARILQLHMDDRRYGEEMLNFIRFIFTDATDAAFLKYLHENYKDKLEQYAITTAEKEALDKLLRQSIDEAKGKKAAEALRSIQSLFKKYKIPRK